MPHFICPVCSLPFISSESSLRCPNGHSFDRAAAGYVNLLRSNTSNHGDDKLMVSARRNFLDGDFYGRLRDILCDTVVKYCPAGSVVLDAGCGEGYYTYAVSKALKTRGDSSSIVAVDVSKNAVTAACKRSKEIEFAVASVYALPIADKTIGMTLSVFSPFAADEFSRVLYSGGYLINVIPGKRHLFSLKAAVYDVPYENEVMPFELAGYELVDVTELDYNMHLDSNETVKNLFTMTPYYYKTPENNKRRLDFLTELDTEAQFYILVYKKADV